MESGPPNSIIYTPKYSSRHDPATKIQGFWCASESSGDRRTHNSIGGIIGVFEGNGQVKTEASPYLCSQTFLEEQRAKQEYLRFEGIKERLGFGK